MGSQSLIVADGGELPSVCPSQPDSPMESVMPISKNRRRGMESKNLDIFARS